MTEGRDQRSVISVTISLPVEVGDGLGGVDVVE
jgi:hypothetical protein